ncbi:MAG: hypothetical protein ACFB0G_02145 [Leptolyngbyaceae cyanobacterium]
MKCSQCHTNNRLKERIAYAGRCKNCRHPFVLGATSRPSPPRLTDVFFQRTIANLSAGGSLSFTHKQLFYSLNRRLLGRTHWLFRPRERRSPSPPMTRRLNLLTAIAAIALIGLGAALLHQGITAFYFEGLGVGLLLAIGGMGLALQVPGHSSVIALLAGGIGLWLGWFYARPAGVAIGAVLLLVGLLLLALAGWHWRQSRRPTAARVLPIRGPAVQQLPISAAYCDEILHQWAAVNGPLPLLTQRPWPVSSVPRLTPDLTLYSFDRVLVCDTDAIAQFLIANNFHFERNCPVLSVNGYPARIFTTLLAMLRRNPELRVYALHDATPAGVAMAYQLQTSPAWFANSTVRIYDLGLSPRQVFDNRKMFVQKSAAAVTVPTMPKAVRSLLTADELRWLQAGRYVELESFLPRTLLQIAAQGIAASRRREAGESQEPSGTRRAAERDDDSWPTAGSVAGVPILIDADDDSFG